MSKGADYTTNKMTVAALKAAGISFVCRYLSGNPGGWKELSRGEADRYTSGGILVVSNWETDGKPSNTVNKGKADAAAALREAEACGMPAGRPIYFSIDSDVPVSSKDLYFKGLCEVLGAERAGVYGSSGLVRHLMGAGLAKWGWRTMSTAWTGGSSVTGMHIRQTHQTRVGSFLVDLNDGLQSDVGGWLVGGSAPTPGPFNIGPYPGHLLKEGANEPAVKKFQNKLALNGYPLVADGDFGPKTKTAVVSFQKNQGLPHDGIIGPLTWSKAAGLLK